MMHAYVHMCSVAPPQDSAHSERGSLQQTLPLDAATLHKQEMAVHGSALRNF